MKTFTVAGFSVLAGVKKMRFANSMDRVKVLMANGHTDIELQELPRAMTKDEIRVFFGYEPEDSVVVAKKPKAEPVAETVAADDDEDPVVWLKPGQVPSYKLTFDTFEAALASVPTREKGRFLSQAAREARARELMLPAVV
jgi:hypothetical protein